MFPPPILPPSFLSFAFLFSKAAPGKCVCSQGFHSLYFFLLVGYPSEPLLSAVSTLLTQPCPFWTCERYTTLEVSETRAAHEPAVRLASDLGLVLSSLLSCVTEES